MDQLGRTTITNQVLGRLNAVMIVGYFDRYLEGLDAAKDATFETRKAKAEAETFFNTLTKHAVVLAQISEDQRFALDFRKSKAKEQTLSAISTAESHLDAVKLRLNELGRICAQRTTPRLPDDALTREITLLRCGRDLELMIRRESSATVFYNKIKETFNLALGRGDLTLCVMMCQQDFMSALVGKYYPGEFYNESLLPVFIDAVLPAASKPYLAAKRKLSELTPGVVLLLEQALRHYIASLDTDLQEVLRMRQVVVNG